MKPSTIHLWADADDDPRGDVELHFAHLHLSHGDKAAVVAGRANSGTAQYLRRLATEADKLADAIDARLAESTGGETRDVPTPGGAS